MSFSVLLSLYDKEKPEFLRASLESVFNQSCKPDSVVLVLDGPINQSLKAVLDEYSKVYKTLKIIPFEKNRGLAWALNDGIDFCGGEYIARMDTDDICMPDRFEKQLAYMSTHPEIDILGGSIQEFNSNCECIGIRNYPQTPEISKKYIHKASPVAHPTVVIRRKVFDAGLRYGTKYGTNEDIALWFDAIKQGFNIASLNDVVLKYRREDSVYQRRNNKKAWGEFKAYCHGIYQLDGIITYKYIYPVARLVFRLMPTAIIKSIYNGKIRKKMLG